VRALRAGDLRIVLFAAGTGGDPAALDGIRIERVGPPKAPRKKSAASGAASAPKPASPAGQH
jgi:hypothetical protein